MRDEFDESFEGARSKQRAKRRKTNIILNSLIGIVIVLIVFVAITIFSGGNKEKAEPEKQEPNNEQVSGAENKSSSDENKEENGNNQDEQQATGTTDEGESAATEGEEEEGELIVEEGTNPNVRKTIINPAWKPVGTEQTGVHETQFDMESVDWQEMEVALAYGAGLDHTNMTTWFISNGGPNQAIGTVSAKDGQQAYRVYIQWVDGQGWKPTKVEELIENDKGQGTRNRES